MGNFEGMTPEEFKKEKARQRAKKWYYENKERAQANMKRYRENGFKNSEYFKNYYQANKERILKNAKKRNLENPEKRKEFNKLYREKNKDKIALYRAKHREKQRIRNKENYQKNPEAHRERARKYRAENPERTKENRNRWRKENPDRVKEHRRRYYLKKRKIVETYRTITTYFKKKIWPYQTKGKNEVTKAMLDFSKDFFPEGQPSFLSMPHFGRELSLMEDFIDLEKSLGIERDFKTFNTILKAFARILPGYEVKHACIDEFSINTKRVFDIAHLDYNGPLIESHLQAAESLVKKDTLTFLTLSEHKRFDGTDFKIPVEELSQVGEIVFQNKYLGLRKCPMITVGII